MSSSTLPHLGTTISTLKLKELELPIVESIEKILSLNLDLLRLSAQWDEIQPNSAEDWQIESIESILKLCEQRQQKVILTVGAKAPRWPEFHIPDWVHPQLDEQQFHDQVLSYLQKVVSHLKKYSCITHWQIENEPLDQSGEKNQTIPMQLLQTEIDLVKSIDNRPIVLTVWGNDLKQRALLPILDPLTDVIGVDLYYKQFVMSTPIGSLYSGPRSAIRELQALTKPLTSDLWITELQAEPWEKNDQVYRSANPQSISVSQLKANLQQALKLQPKAILFWGSEYWVWRHTQGDDSYLQFVRDLLGN